MSKPQPLKYGISSTRSRRPSHSLSEDHSSPLASSGKKSSSKSESDASAIKVDINPSTPMPIIRTEHRNKEKCPCNKSVKSSWKLDCHKCHQYWHADCMGLGGLSEKEINKLTQWSCPFCWVSPISTLDTDVHVCHVCRNTLSLQQSNLEFEASIAHEKLKNVSKCCNLIELINFNDLGKNIDTIAQFDQRLKHLLLKEDSLRGLDSEIKNLTVVLSSLSSVQSEHAEIPELKSIDKNISDLQRDLEDLKNRESPSVLAPPASESTDTLLKDISEKLDKLCNEESGISADMSQMKQSIESMKSSQQSNLAPSSALCYHPHSLLQHTPCLPCLKCHVHLGLTPYLTISRSLIVKSVLTTLIMMQPMN